MCTYPDPGIDSSLLITTAEPLELSDVLMFVSELLSVQLCATGTKERDSTMAIMKTRLFAYMYSPPFIQKINRKSPPGSYCFGAQIQYQNVGYDFSWVFRRQKCF